MNDNIPEIFNLPVETSIASGDLIPIFDVSAGQLRKITQANLTAGVGVTDHGALTGLSDNDHPQYLLVADIDDTPVNGEVAQPISSNWAFDHVAAADPHTGYRLESADHNHQSTGAEGGQLDHGLALTGLSDDDHTIYLLADGTRGLSAAWDAGSWQIRAETFQSDVATGTAPFTVASTTACTNLNADMVDGVHASAIYQSGGTDVAVADGGTGRSSHTAYAVICGGTTGTGAQQSIASVGTTGQVLTSNDAGALPTFQDLPSLPAELDPQVTTIDATDATWAEPSGDWTMCMIECWGGGGSGGRGVATAAAGGGGGGGYERRIMRRADMTFPINVQIGAGGTAQTSASSNGNAGGTTTFGTYATAYGGGGGMGTETTGLNSGGSGGSNMAAGTTNATASGPSPFGTDVNATFSARACACGGGAGSAAAGGNGGPGAGWWGAGGGAPSNGATLTNGNGGDAAWGGAGGGAGAEDSSPGPGSGGTSKFGGNGGAGGRDTIAGTAGTQPGGGGGGSEAADSGAGGAGRVRFTRW